MKSFKKEKTVNCLAEADNCRQSVLQAANDIRQLDISADLVSGVTSFYKEMNSGCSRRAWSGMETAGIFYEFVAQNISLRQDLPGKVR